MHEGGLQYIAGRLKDLGIKLCIMYVFHLNKYIY